MFYISRIQNGKYYITDTRDNIEEVVPIDIIKSFVLGGDEILGVHRDFILACKPTSQIVDVLKRVHSEQELEIFKYLDVYESIELRFRSKPNKLGIVNNTNIGIRRLNLEEYELCIEGGSSGSKSRKVFDLEYLLSEVAWYYKCQVLVSVKKLN